MPLLNKRILNKFYAKSEHFKNEPKFHELKNYFGAINSRIEKKDFGNESSERQEFISCFLKILGYKFNDNFWFENATMNGRSIDACIGTNIDNIKKVEVAIEWKGIDTKHLDKKINAREESPVSQMWDYMGKEAAHIGIVSNFEEIRIYSLNKGQVEYQLYTLKNLVNDDKLLIEFYSLLRFDMLLKANNNISKFEELVISSDAEQELITKEFYRDYKQCRIALYSHLVENNIIDKNTLLEKTQKILDRLIFIMFCEDSPAFLINSGTIRNNYNDVMKSFTNDDQKVWNSFKGLFEYIDKGNDYHGINAFNGGLFAEDSELNNLVIKNNIWKQLTALAEYDFASDLDVNILGHIFEQSIADIENIKNVINGIEPKKKKKTIRNKDGIFYTPEYITEYIVENTIGEWLKENPEGLDTIKVLDPAGGSGAFLNQAHTYLAKAQAEALNQKITADGFDNLADQDAYSIDKSILNNNLYMVDLQQESVEIAKLSLWLKTASKLHKLNNLDANIKCGNSLIDDPQVAGIRAFNWNQEFPTVMENGGFDVIIGNPPYVNIKLINEIEKGYYAQNYESAQGQYDLYILFIEQSLKHLKVGGYIGFIIPNKFLITQYGLKIRKIIIENSLVFKYKDVSDEAVFEDASVYPVIIVFKKTCKNLSDLKDVNILDYFNINNTTKEILQIKMSKYKLGDVCKITEGIHTGNIREKLIFNTKKESFKNILRGQDIERYGFNFENLFIDNKVIPDKTKSEYANIPNVKNFENEKLLLKDIALRPTSVFDSENYYVLNTLYTIQLKEEFNNILNLKYINAIINSRVIMYFFENEFRDAHVGGGYLRCKKQYSSQIPIPDADDNQQNEIVKLVEKIILETKSLNNIVDNFIQLISSKYIPKILSNKLKLFYNLNFSEFLTELKKQRVKIDSLSAESELLQYFEQEKKKINELQAQIEQVDNEIEALVVKLYGLEGVDLEI
jgi:TaqI-like C-terminal specificity domain/Eco57I restriction-modification methylase